MRIIGGDFKGRRLRSPPEQSTTRPLPDKVKEAYFNLLRGHFDDVQVLDLFSGTGSFGLEAVSRGASSVTCVEKDRAVVRVLEGNIATLGCEERVRVIQGDALGLSLVDRLHPPFHIIFADPPYAMVGEPNGYQRVRAQLSRLVPLLTPDGYLSFRTPWPFIFGEVDDRVDGDLSIDGAEGPETHVYRKTAVHLYMRADR